MRCVLAEPLKSVRKRFQCISEPMVSIVALELVDVDDGSVLAASLERQIVDPRLLWLVVLELRHTKKLQDQG